MKKIALLFSLCLMATLVFAHEVPVPHAHQDYVHGVVPFLQYVVAPLVIVWMVFKLYKRWKQSSQV